jgi:hypothetical protein
MLENSKRHKTVIKSKQINKHNVSTKKKHKEQWQSNMTKKMGFTIKVMTFLFNVIVTFNTVCPNL